MKNYDVLNELVPKTQELHREIFDKGYEQGQTDILDKIKAEIDQDAFKDVNGSKYIFVNRINQIIDSHKKKVEEEK